VRSHTGRVFDGKISVNSLGLQDVEGHHVDSVIYHRPLCKHCAHRELRSLTLTTYTSWYLKYFLPSAGRGRDLAHPIVSTSRITMTPAVVFVSLVASTFSHVV
jgi:hypothetical protein